MAATPTPSFPDSSREESDRFREILGYLNFSEGKVDPGFQANLNTLHSRYSSVTPWSQIHADLSRALSSLETTSEAFTDSDQARAVLEIVFTGLFPAYTAFHRDLLFHVSAEELQQPFFLAKLFEAVLAQGGPWHETDRIISGALNGLNDFVGYRPVAVLENERQMEPYAHERYRPIPLYLRGVGVAGGRYRELIQGTIAFLHATPPEILSDSYFELARMEELAVDIRAHDHLHPVNKRTNYMFGEWDPHQIDHRGLYRRFVIRRIILEALLQWMRDFSEIPREELVYDASAVLCGTTLMASAISGAGPESHSSDISLTKLLPKVARQRDAFYDRLMEQAAGARAKRLAAHMKQTQQPFGHVRQYLNMYLARYGARQVQHRQVSHLYARMGYVDAARQQAAVIPCVAARFETEIQCLITSAHLHLDRSEVPAAGEIARELETLLHRGIECGALIDPWNILGFQAQFPLFIAREDSVPDHRAETLLELMEGIFGVFARVLGESAAQGLGELRDSIAKTFHVLAHFWDRYATGTVQDLPKVSGQESYLSASRVSRGLSDWRAGGEEAGNITFWREKVEEFESAKAFSLLVSALLHKRDHIASMALLIQWLSKAETVGLESGPHNIFDQLRNWMQAATERLPHEERWPVLKRFFDYLEANAGIYWNVPSNASLDLDLEDVDEDLDLDEYFDGLDDPDEAEGEDSGLFGSAYDEFKFRDSAEDGVAGETIEGGYGLEPTEFEILHRHLEPHLKFVLSLAQLWQMASSCLGKRTAASPDEDAEDDEPPPLPAEHRDAVLAWYHKSIDLQKGLTRLLISVWEQEIEGGQGDHDSNVEYDLQLQSKFHLLYSIINAYVNMTFASWSLVCLLERESSALAEDRDERLMIDYFRAIFDRRSQRVRQLTPRMLESLRKKPLLYVPFENGGQPGPVLAARKLQTYLRFLLSQLPQMGLLHETYSVLHTAFRMERETRPPGLAVTEFDQLFRAALSNTLHCVSHSSRKWKSGRFAEEELVDLVSELAECYLELWLQHSRSMRLSTVEGIADQESMNRTREFIIKYGSDLFHARMLSLGNVRAILHSGIEPFIEHLKETTDPLHPVRLVEDLEEGIIAREDAVEHLEIIYGSVVDKFDRFLEYNSTTTHSDYGEKFFCFMDFLRVEARYDRDAWNMAPIAIAHEILCRDGHFGAALTLEKLFSLRTEEIADRHVEKLHALELRYGMVLPSLADHVNERFVKPLSVNRMLALVPQAVNEAGTSPESLAAFEKLRAEIEEYVKTSSGSAIDVPVWLRTLEKELDLLHPQQESFVFWSSSQPVLNLSRTTINLREMKRQLKLLAKPVRPRRKKPPRKKSSSDEEE